MMGAGLSMRRKRKDPLMPLVMISLRAGKPAAYREAILESLHLAMRDTLGIAEDNRFMTISEHDGTNFSIGDAYGVKRSEDLVYVQIIVFDSRTADQKKELFRRVVELLGKNPGVKPEDVFIIVKPVPKENWSVGHGHAQFV